MPDRTMHVSGQSASSELMEMKNLFESIDNMIFSVGKPSIEKTIDDKILIAKKLRVHIKN